MRILERTFGLEIEIVDVDKKSVELPVGFDWSVEEVVHNTDGSRGTFSSARGGEINSPPLLLSCGTRIKLKNLYKSIVDNGGKVTRELSIQPHIYIGDLELEKVKNIFYLLYYTANYIDEVCEVSKLSKFNIFTPSPTIEDYNKVKRAASFDNLKSAFENSTNKGFVRHIVNISSYFKTKTVEFRPFWGTTDYDTAMNCVLFSYRFVDYALNHTEEDFKNIKSIEDFKAKLKVRNKLPAEINPLLFYGNPLSTKEALAAKKIDMTAALVKYFLDKTPEQIALVNPSSYLLELKSYKTKKITIYNTDEFNHIIYSIIKNGLKIEYTEEVKFIQQYNGEEPIKQLACLLFFEKAKKFIARGNNSEFAKANMDACILGSQKSIEKAMVLSQKLISMLETVEYKNENLNDAIRDNENVFFQFDNYSRNRTTVALLRKNSNYQETFSRKKTQYFEVESNLPENTTLSMVSQNPYLNLHKHAQVGSIYYYSSEEPKTAKIIRKAKKEESIVFNEPPDDLDINDVQKLKIVSVPSTTYRIAQRNYIAKVHKISLARNCYFVMYENYLIGGFGFDVPKNMDYDIWLLSDFATNNKIPRISKLILLCINSKALKTSISRKMSETMQTCYTKVYTQSPVSMKYRGIFTKRLKEKFFLMYDTILGTSGTMKEVIEKYQQYKKAAK